MERVGDEKRERDAQQRFGVYGEAAEARNVFEGGLVGSSGRRDEVVACKGGERVGPCASQQPSLRSTSGFAIGERRTQGDNCTRAGHTMLVPFPFLRATRSLKAFLYVLD